MNRQEKKLCIYIYISLPTDQISSSLGSVRFTTVVRASDGTRIDRGTLTFSVVAWFKASKI